MSNKRVEFTTNLHNPLGAKVYVDDVGDLNLSLNGIDILFISAGTGDMCLFTLSGSNVRILEDAGVKLKESNGCTRIAVDGYVPANEAKD